MNVLYITIHHKINNLHFGAAVLDKKIQLTTKVRRNGRIGAGEILVLTLRTTHFFDKTYVALAVHLVVKFVGVDGSPDRAGHKQCEQNTEFVIGRFQDLPLNKSLSTDRPRRAGDDRVPKRPLRRSLLQCREATTTHAQLPRS